MDKAFGWIGEIFQTLLKLLPWLVIVPATHGGVAFVRGNRVKEWKAGLHWYWPVATSYKLMAVVRQTQRIQSKVIMTKDLKTVIVGALVTYHVDDVVSALAKIADLPSDIMERSQGAIFDRDQHAARWKTSSPIAWPSMRALPQGWQKCSMAMACRSCRGS